MKNILQPVKRAAASDVFTLSPAVAGSRVFLNSLLGLAPQALCCRPLRGLRELLPYSSRAESYCPTFFKSSTS